jgi:hypothetical protein
MTTLKKLIITTMVLAIGGGIYELLNMISRDSLRTAIEYGMLGVAFLWVYLMVDLIVSDSKPKA